MSVEAANRFSDEEVELLREVATVLDAVWDVEASMGARDTRPSVEYGRVGLGPKVRRMLGEEER